MKIKIAFILFALPVLMIAQEANEYFSSMKFRNIGPFRGGRSVSATGIVNNPLTYYMGTTGGGLWKTEDAGAHWNNISDGFFKTGSVGAVAASESNPNIIYVGMGEHAIRGVMTSYGDGVYKSTDAGKTWKHIGLTKTEQISRIVIHPTNPDIVYVAAQGKYSAPTEERGIYKSVDGGKTWKKTLFVNNFSGASELSMDMNNPQILYAALWHHQRTPWKMISGGEGSGLYKSTDAGETWTKLEKGLPKALGKLAIAVCRSNSNKVYALVESDSQTDNSGLYVSNNAGKSWKQVSGDNRLTQRAWYYTEVFTDPNNEETVYVLSAPALRSKDGGKTWSRITGTHGDFHDLWINPNNSNNMVIANDGGAAISFNFAKTWSSQNIMPTAQFYRINVDNLSPYNIYAGQQDNTSVRIASMNMTGSSISERNWTPAAGGESAFLAFDKDNPTITVGGSYLGTIEALDMKTKVSTDIIAAPIQYLGKAARDMKYLYNWNAPIVWSQHEKNTIFHAAQLVLKSTDMGKTWTHFSPDLTRNIDAKQGKGGGPYTNEAVGAENYGTISYLIESPHEKGVFYSGSDDGLVHVTRDNGKTWQNITPKNLGETLVNAIEVSPHNPAVVYIATTKYKLGDYTPALFKSENYGKTWKAINNGIPQGAHTRVIREDKAKKGLLYAGTELGMYISFDDGSNWTSFQRNLPVTPILDLMVHQNDLVVATSGRSFWILDNLSLLSQYDAKNKEAKIYNPEPISYGNWGSSMSGNTDSFTGMQNFTGINPANGIELYYELPKVDASKAVTLTVTDSNGKVINSYTSEKDTNYVPHNGGGAPRAPRLPKKEGLNRFVWNMQHKIVPGVPKVYIEASFRGHKVVPGEYTMTLSYDGKTYSTKAVIKENPDYNITKAEYKAYDAIMSELEANATDMHNKVNLLNSVAKDIREALKRLKKTNKASDLIKTGESLLKDIKEWDEKMVQRRSQAYDDVENFENKFTADYLFLMNQTNSSLPKITQASVLRKQELDKEWDTLKQTAESLINTKIPEFNKKLWHEGIGAISLK
ncbi:WD40/YVTN/BNR-like repeat-containing protein [Seonamhaeicola marinus]|uniref:Glycosyl hydrolase n=1 Tax=Seonamhaeicola marinus TaxID=1912246 RepID=A0A5D0HKY3_9FLAO|nr:glycosyl hydrolase [Seonamhaeicola marinus]TYA71948.1 glycosyl hydrolase [Seonamhaeicola marinus]